MSINKQAKSIQEEHITQPKANIQKGHSPHVTNYFKNSDYNMRQHTYNRLFAQIISVEINTEFTNNQFSEFAIT